MKRTSTRIAVACAAAVAVTAGGLLTVNAFADDARPGGDVGADIIGGTDASEEYGFVGSLQWEADGDPNAHHCGVTLVDPQWVVTAAHCVADEDGTPHDPDPLHISIGSNDRTKGTTIGIDSLTVHPDWGTDAADDADIAMLHLAEAAPTEPIGVATWDSPSTRVRMVGWGRTVADDPDSLPVILQELTTSVLDPTECVFGDEYDITPSDLCADNPGENAEAGACYGDSGSPLLAEDVNDEWVIMGAASRSGGEGACAMTDEVYVSAAYYRDWILGITGE